jgi:hypothetical protein
MRICDILKIGADLFSQSVPKHENIQFSYPNWCCELQQFEPYATFFARDMKLGLEHDYQ